LNILNSSSITFNFWRSIQHSAAFYFDLRFKATADRIERAFEADAVLRRFDLDAEQENRTHIELEGTVRTRARRSRALSIARANAPRQFHIVNRIRIGR
jgi:ABC-type taurine transport system ATPase subunit